MYMKPNPFAVSQRRSSLMLDTWSSELHGRPVTVYLAGATPQLSNLAPIIQSANKEYK